jgi:hydrogenase maturation protease
MKPSTLILGIGNEILMDDGIGPRIVYDLGRLPEIPDAAFEIICTGGLEIMEYIKGYKRVIFIDAIRTTGGKPGDVFYFKPSDFAETMHLSSLHDINFLTALELGKCIDPGFTSDLHIIAVEIVEDRQFGNEFTTELRKKYPEIRKQVLSIIKSIMV